MDESLRKRICKLVVDKIVLVYVNIYSEEDLVNMLSSMFRPKVSSIDKMSEMVTNNHLPSKT